MGLTKMVKCQSMNEVHIKGYMYVSKSSGLQSSIYTAAQCASASTNFFFVFLGLTKKNNPLLVFLTKTLLSYAATYMVQNFARKIKLPLALIRSSKQYSTQKILSIFSALNRRSAMHPYCILFSISLSLLSSAIKGVVHCNYIGCNRYSYMLCPLCMKPKMFYTQVAWTDW